MLMTRSYHKYFLVTGNSHRQIARRMGSAPEPPANSSVEGEGKSLPRRKQNPTWKPSSPLTPAPPTSSVAALPAESGRTFMVQRSGADDPGSSGIASYDIYVSTNGGPRSTFARSGSPFTSTTNSPSSTAHPEVWPTTSRSREIVR